jgi:hypothetical protein
MDSNSSMLPLRDYAELSNPKYIPFELATSDPFNSSLCHWVGNPQQSLMVERASVK